MPKARIDKALQKANAKLVREQANAIKRKSKTASNKRLAMQKEKNKRDIAQIRESEHTKRTVAKATAVASTANNALSQRNKTKELDAKIAYYQTLITGNQNGNNAIETDDSNSNQSKPANSSISEGGSSNYVK